MNQLQTIVEKFRKTSPNIALAFDEVDRRLTLLENDTPAPPAPTAAWPQNPFPKGSIWNPIGPLNNPVVDPNSNKIISAWLTQGPNAGNVKFVCGDWGVAVTQVVGGETKYKINVVPDGHGPSNLNRFGDVPIPNGTSPAGPPMPNSDAHLAILDYKNGIEWGLWRARFESGVWSCTTGGAQLFTEIAGIPGIAGSNTANLPLSAGLITPEDMASGVIKHPLVFYSSNIGTPQGNIYRCPATYSYGKAAATTNPILGGMWLQLSPSINVEGLSIPKWQKIILKALQDYGCFCRDQSSGPESGFYGEAMVGNQGRTSILWTSQGLNSGSNMFSTSIPWQSMRVLVSPC